MDGGMIILLFKAILFVRIKINQLGSEVPIVLAHNKIKLMVEELSDQRNFINSFLPLTARKW
jgi:hypothetical protein